MDNTIPLGFCQCGCGQLTRIIQQSNIHKGRIKGQPARFLPGHNNWRPLVDRFWEKVDQSGGPDACWPWLGGQHTGGYGRIGRGGVGSSTPATHIAWELTYGPIPNGMIICHKCDNPPCCNPVHLFVGTHKTNAADKIAKGRARPTGAIGERNSHARLTVEQVRKIRQRYAQGDISQTELAKEYKVRVTNISMILLRHTWKHVE